MSSSPTIKALVDAQTFAAARFVATEQGMSVEQFAGEAIRRAVADQAEMVAAIEKGRRQIAAGEGLTHEQLAANLQRWKRERKRAA